MGPILFPLFIPKGSRLSARVQASNASRTVDVAITLTSGGMMAGGHAMAVSDYGATTGSLGTAIDPGATPDTDSAWVEITAATTRAHRWLVISGFFGDLGLAATTLWRYSVGIGAASSEVVLVPDIHVGADVTVDLPSNPIVCLPCAIPAGSRLSVRMRCSSADAGDRTANIRLYGA